MIRAITEQSLTSIKNPVLAAYARIYIDIYADFMKQVEQTGLSVDASGQALQVNDQINRLQKKMAVVRNHSKSVYINHISPSCLACQTGILSATFFISLKCSRKCFYCFNPNQEEYDFFREHHRDTVAELERMAADNRTLQHIALTGGEPLLHKAETVAFFTAAKRLYPQAYTRLYTCGDLVDERILVELQQAGLDEIRFSIRLHDPEAGRRQAYDKIALAKKFIPYVTVEMPVLPGSYEMMADILLELERLQVFSINLLEFCFPFANADEFQKRDFRIKSPPFRVLYNYWYAGGLPVSGSEGVCLDLLEFALDRGLKLGVHYCSLENKHTGQIYQQNGYNSYSPLYTFSRKDYFLKSAKVFGDDIPTVLQFFERVGNDLYETNPEYNYLEFPVQVIKGLTDFDVEICISTGVVEVRDEETVVRELSLALTTPQTFDPDTDI